MHSDLQLKTSFDRHLIAFIKDIWVVESTRDVRILITSPKIAELHCSCTVKRWPKMLVYIPIDYQNIGTIQEMETTDT